MKSYLLRGVPQSVQLDGWWLSSAPPTPRPRDGAAQSPQWRSRAGALVVLIALADLLLWQVVPGLSLAVFGLAVLSLAGSWPDVGALPVSPSPRCFSCQ